MGGFLPPLPRAVFALLQHHGEGCQVCRSRHYRVLHPPIQEEHVPLGRPDDRAAEFGVQRGHWGYLSRMSCVAGQRHVVQDAAWLAPYRPAQFVGPRGEERHDGRLGTGK